MLQNFADKFYVVFPDFYPLSFSPKGERFLTGTVEKGEIH
jgi:hypothetical protein